MIKGIMKLKSRKEFLNESLDKFFDEVPYEGDYDCSKKYLMTSLVELNIPSTINGSFICYGNSLTSLEGSPQEVNGNFDCSSNKLTSLEGCPEIVNGNFSCSNNPKLKNLDFLLNISGYFQVQYCPLITKKMLGEVRKSGKVKGRIVCDFDTELVDAFPIN